MCTHCHGAKGEGDGKGEDAAEVLDDATADNAGADDKA